MLPRRHIRIKVLQSLYARSQQIQDKEFDAGKEYKKNLDGYLNIYYLIIHLLRLLKELADLEINIKKQNLVPSKEDLLPNKRFVKNFIFKKINKTKQKPLYVEDEKIKIIVKKIFQKIKKSKKYISYMEASSISKEGEKQIIFHVLKKYFIGNEIIHEFIEDCSIYWNDDILIAYNFLIEKINKNEQINTIKLFRNKEDELFGSQLLKETIKKEHNVSEIIYQLAKNWDKDRIATIDLIIMRMAIIEMTYIKNIPQKVTLDEYIEISKEYSTPKSKEFINGVLDEFIKYILPKKFT